MVEELKIIKYAQDMNITINQLIYLTFINHYTQQPYNAHSFNYKLKIHQDKLYPEPLKTFFKFKLEITEIIQTFFQTIRELNKQLVIKRQKENPQIFENLKAYF